MRKFMKFSRVNIALKLHYAVHNVLGDTTQLIAATWYTQHANNESYFNQRQEH